MDQRRTVKPCPDCYSIGIPKNISTVRWRKPCKIHAQHRASACLLISINLNSGNPFKFLIQNLHQISFFFMDYLHTCLKNKSHSGIKGCDPGKIMGSRLIFIIVILINKFCAVCSCSPKFQRDQPQSRPYIKASCSLNSHKAFMSCKNKGICSPFLCIYGNTACTLRNICNEDQSVFFCKSSHHIHILNTPGHIGTVIYYNCSGPGSHRTFQCCQCDPAVFFTGNHFHFQFLC